MPWFKVDDNLPFHAKVVAAGNPAMGLWVRAGAWSSQQLTEGFIPLHIVDTLGTRAQAKRLVSAGLWVEKDGGYLFWQWSDDGRQPTRAQVNAEREAARERQRRARDKSRAKRGTDAPDDETSQRDDNVTDGVTHAVTDGVTNAVSHAPVTGAVTGPPTRPDPTRPLVGSRSERDRRETLTAADATKPPPTPPPGTRPADARCTAHQGVTDPGPCNGCRRERERAERDGDRAADLAERDRQRRAAQCANCDGVHIVDPQTKLPTRRRCDHPEARRTA